MTDPRKSFRTRRRNVSSEVTVPFEGVLEELRPDHVSAERWRELRPLAIRSLLHEKPAMTAEMAARVVDAFFAKPKFIPMRRPRGSKDD
jgi:hypothetical protein